MEKEKVPAAPPKLSDVERTVADIRKKFGDDSLMRLTDKRVEKVAVISSGSLALNRAMGCGGYPRGRIIEVYGPESSGKTTLTLHAIAECQAAGGVAAFIDAEHALDVDYARRLGVRVDDLLISQPDHGEQALEITENLIASGTIALVVVDSVAALVPKAELEGEMGDTHMGLHARLMSQALRKLTGVVHRTGTTLIFINQLRMKIGVMFGSPETTTGGNALKFYASMRLDVRRREQRKDADDLASGNLTEIKIVKNKLAPPFRKAEFDIIYGQGIDKIGDLINVAVELGVITRSGAWYSTKGVRLSQGYNNLVLKLKEDVAVQAQVLAEVLALEVAR